MRGVLGWGMGWGLVALLAQASCGGVEREAKAVEVPPAALDGVSAETHRCELGSLQSVSRCGDPTASCHICARLETAEGVCVQPCTLGGDECPSGQACRPIGELRDAGGYARIGDCPAGYCR